jgi:hypothetical protein
VQLEENRTLRNLSPRGAFLHRLCEIMVTLQALQEVLLPAAAAKATAAPAEATAAAVDGDAAAVDAVDAIVHVDDDDAVVDDDDDDVEDCQAAIVKSTTAAAGAPASATPAASPWRVRLRSAAGSAGPASTAGFLIENLEFSLNYLVEMIVDGAHSARYLAGRVALYAGVAGPPAGLRARGADPEARRARVLAEARAADAALLRELLAQRAQGVKIALAITITSALVTVPELRDATLNGFWAVVVIALIRQVKLLLISSSFHIIIIIRHVKLHC